MDEYGAGEVDGVPVVSVEDDVRSHETSEFVSVVTEAHEVGGDLGKGSDVDGEPDAFAVEGEDLCWLLKSASGNDEGADESSVRHQGAIGGVGGGDGGEGSGWRVYLKELLINDARVIVVSVPHVKGDESRFRHD